MKQLWRLFKMKPVFFFVKVSVLKKQPITVLDASENLSHWSRVPEADTVMVGFRKWPGHEGGEG